MRFSTSIFFTIFTVASFFGDTSAAPFRPSQLKTRDVISPRITSPKQDDLFLAGDTTIVTWDTSSVPPGSTDLGKIVLAQPTEGSENLQPNSPLAINFPLTAGQQNITFPLNLPTGVNYAIVLFGDSGNISPQFTIVGNDGIINK